jgi:hypothetical protein
VDDCVVDVSFDTLGGLRAVTMLEAAARAVGHRHLVKRAVLLVKAWCFYEARVIGGHHGLLSTYALETMVLRVLAGGGVAVAGAGGAVSQPPLHTPLDVLRSFLATYAAFDWDADTLTALGAVPTAAYAARPALPPLPRDASPAPTPACPLPPPTMAALLTAHATPLAAGAPFPPFAPKHINIADPLLPYNNLGRPLALGAAVRVRKALVLGSALLEAALAGGDRDGGAGVDALFRNAWHARAAHFAARVLPAQRAAVVGAGVVHPRPPPAVVVAPPPGFGRPLSPTERGAPGWPLAGLVAVPPGAVPVWASGTARYGRGRARGPPARWSAPGGPDFVYMPVVKAPPPAVAPGAPGGWRPPPLPAPASPLRGDLAGMRAQLAAARAASGELDPTDGGWQPQHGAPRFDGHRPHHHHPAHHHHPPPPANGHPARPATAAAAGPPGLDARGAAWPSLGGADGAPPPPPPAAPPPGAPTLAQVLVRCSPAKPAPTDAAKTPEATGDASSNAGWEEAATPPSSSATLGSLHSRSLPPSASVTPAPSAGPSPAKAGTVETVATPRARSASPPPRPAFGEADFPSLGVGRGRGGKAGGRRGRV